VCLLCAPIRGGPPAREEAGAGGNEAAKKKVELATCKPYQVKQRSQSRCHTAEKGPSTLANPPAGQSNRQSQGI